MNLIAFEENVGIQDKFPRSQEKPRRPKKGFLNAANVGKSLGTTPHLLATRKFIA